LGSKLSSVGRVGAGGGNGISSLTRAGALGTNKAVSTFAGAGSLVHSFASSSANDALLDAAAADAAGGYGDWKQKETTQLAWGLKEKMEDQVRSGAVAPVVAKELGRAGSGAGSLAGGGDRIVLSSLKSKGSTVSDVYSNQGMTSTHTRETYTTNDPTDRPETPPNREPTTPYPPKETNTSDQFSTRRTSSNESQPEPTNTEPPHKITPPGEGQEAYMAKLARDAAEKRRREEQTRVREQKERAAQRLYELEKKTGKSSTSKAGSSLVTFTASIHPSESSRWRQHSSGPSSEVVLEPLGSTKGNGENRSLAGGDVMSDVKRAPRKLFDPNRSYSSLVGGSKNSKTELVSEDVGPHSRTNRESTRKEVSVSITPHETEVTTSSFRKQQDPAAVPAAPSSMIQLSSYEDRDRGGRKTNAGPRMLFDPKSGSLVAAPRKDDNSAFGKGRKDKTKTKVRNTKEREDAPVGQSLSKRIAPSNVAYGRFSPDNPGAPDESTDTKYAKHRNSRRDDLATRKEKKRADKEKKIADSVRSTAFENGQKNKSRSSGSKNDSSPTHQQRLKLPRTRGVLYKRDDYGSLVSADKCEGDQGYGAHSVPGGRLKNVKAFNSFVKRQQRTTHAPVEGDTSTYFGAHTQPVYPKLGPSVAASDYESNGLRSTPGLNRSHFMKTHSPQSPSTPVHETLEKDLNIPSPLRVKPNERIELLTGEEDSPTLQASAAAWAPSEAALAAAAAATPTDNSGTEVNSHDSDELSESDVHMSAMAFIDHDIESEESVSVSLKLGLGFDPTENMDSVIMTPATGNGDKPSGIDLPELALDTSHVATEERTISNPFGGLGPSLCCPTWGTGASNMPMGPLSNWDLLGSGSEQNVDASGSSSEQKECTAASFLSLGNLNGSQNTWGSGGLVSGFTTLAGTPLGNVEPQGSVDKD